MRLFIAGNFGVIVFLFSAAINAAVLFDYESSPFSRYPLWDAANYWNHALEIAGGNWIGTTIFHQTPLYPYVLSFFIAVFGDHLFPVYVFQCLLSACTSMLVSKIGYKASGNWFPGFLSGILYALYGMQVFYTTKLLTENLALFLIVLTVWLVLEGKTTPKLLLAGLCFGLLLITKSYFLIALPVILFFYYHSAQKVYQVFIKQVLLFLLPCILVILTVAVRNYHVGGEFVLFTSNFGENVYIGNHMNATATYVPIEGVSSNIAYQDSDVVALAQHLSGKKLSRSEVSKYWFHRSIMFIQKNPVKYIALEWKKVVYIISGIDLTNMYILDFEKKNMTHLFVLPFVSYYLLFPFFLAGIGYALYLWRSYILIVTFLFSNYLMMLLFFYDSRFLLVSMPFFIIISTLGFCSLFISIKKSIRVKKVSVNMAAVVLLCGLPLGYMFCKKNSTITAYDAQKWMAAGEIYYSLGKFEQSVDAFLNASNLNKFDFWPAMGISKVIFKMGQKDAAADLFKESYKTMSTDQKLSVIREHEYDQIREFIIANGIMDSAVFRVNTYR